MGTPVLDPELSHWNPEDPRLRVLEAGRGWGQEAVNQNVFHGIPGQANQPIWTVMRPVGWEGTLAALEDWKCSVSKLPVTESIHMYLSIPSIELCALNCL